MRKERSDCIVLKESMRAEADNGKDVAVSFAKSKSARATVRTIHAEAHWAKAMRSGTSMASPSSRPFPSAVAPPSPIELWKERHRAAVRIQGWMRVLGLPVLREKRVLKTAAAALGMQRVFRGWLGRMSTKRQETAREIQRVFRGWRVRVKAEEMRDARRLMLLHEGMHISR